jgi:hypothetical protein
MPHQRPIEVAILRPPGRILRDGQVVGVDAEADRAARFGRLDPNDTLLPPGRERGRLRTDPLRVAGC